MLIATAVYEDGYTEDVTSSVEWSSDKPKVVDFLSPGQCVANEAGTAVIVATDAINGFRKAKADGKLKNVRIWVRRGGPREKEGLDAMRALKDEGFDINVFDRNTPLTDIVDKALHKQ